jgi:hypothetical protein
MLAMAKQPKKGRRGRRPSANRTESVTLQARVSPDLARAFEALVYQTRRAKQTEIILALEGHLKLHGLWPPAGSPTGPKE